MFVLRFPPPHRRDPQHFARVRSVIALVLDTQKRRGNRAGNQAIVDEVGVDVRLERDEGYCDEALDYHLGLLYAHLGEAEMAAHHFERSNTHPGAGGNPLFSDHQSESLELRRRQELAKQRAIPSVLIASMPRSGSASLTQTIAGLLDIPIMRASCGDFPNFLLIPRWFNSSSSGGAILHDHFGAIPFNLKVLRDGKVDEVFVTVRDPRAAAASAVHLSEREQGSLSEVAFEDRLQGLYEQGFIPWLQTWMAVASDPGGGLKVHWLRYSPNPEAVGDLAKRALGVLAASHPQLEPYAAADIPLVKANFVTGDDGAWRKQVSQRAMERLWDATPPQVRELLDLQP
jgi:hypothetical protein